MRVYLIGYRCCGKTSVGKNLSSKLGLNFFDTDVHLQENQGEDISDIVEKKGWEYFRDLESYSLSRVSEYDNAVVSTGGGIIERQENIHLMKKKGKVVWLGASVSTIASRLEKDSLTAKTRPALTDKSIFKEIEEVLEKRSHLYESASDYYIDTDNLTIEEIVDKLIKIFKI